MGDTASQAAPLGAMQRAQNPKETYAKILKSQQTLPLSSETPGLGPRERDPESQTPATSPGLQALSHYDGSPWLEPFPVPEIKGSQHQKQAPDTGASTQKLPRKVRGFGDTK